MAMPLKYRKLTNESSTLNGKTSCRSVSPEAHQRVLDSRWQDEQPISTIQHVSQRCLQEPQTSSLSDTRTPKYTSIHLFTTTSQFGLQHISNKLHHLPFLPRDKQPARRLAQAVEGRHISGIGVPSRPV
ncbi:hypothetical protein LTR37_001426 [Vermiconidia calcicola]|uniref:Uncharacterized protein n=1 Tax=Vermiconidia calcicola TaxID=1690605 RepID=A0ACC3NW46_9PEZI|nr:hypothetical protein LTR37_001426 [Vermiconidia calcicola]